MLDVMRAACITCSVTPETKWDCFGPKKTKNAARASYDQAGDILFIDAAGVRVETRDDIDAFFNGIAVPG